MSWQTNKQNSLLCLVMRNGIANTGKQWWLGDLQTSGGRQGHPDQTKVVKC